MSELTHLDAAGAAHMVDVSGKQSTVRIATASGRIDVAKDALSAIAQNLVKKGDVLAVARVAGIMAAKNTSMLIPLCHPLPLSSVGINFEMDDDGIAAIATAKTTGQTGVEMEALTAVSVALLTIYDMAKALDKGMLVRDIRLLEKRGGKSGDWVAP